MRNGHKGISLRSCRHIGYKKVSRPKKKAIARTSRFKLETPFHQMGTNFIHLGHVLQDFNSTLEDIISASRSCGIHLQIGIEEKGE